MPSNKQYIDEANELAAKLDVAITTDGLNNEKLAELVADLKAQLKARQGAEENVGALLGGTRGDEDSAEVVGAAFQTSGLSVDEWNALSYEKRDYFINLQYPPEDLTPGPVKKDEPVKRPPFYVKEGKALTTKRGIKSDGQEITAADLAGGEKALNRFVESGHVGKG